MVIMFCAFDRPPRIVRLHGRGSVIEPGQEWFSELASHFPPHAGTRAIIHLTLTRVSTSCGYGVPLLDFRERPEQLERWTGEKGPEGLEAYRAEKNRKSIDGLPAFDRTP